MPWHGPSNQAPGRGQVGESFTLSWTHGPGQEVGRSTVWLHPSIPLRFVFDDPEPALLSRAWVEELANSANSSGGLLLVPEPGGDAPKT